jgi:hypothetical protein
MIPGIDATTPLGFLAALGVLRILDERANHDGIPGPRLAFREAGRWRPVVEGIGSADELVAHVKADVQAWDESSVLQFRYIKMTKKGPKRFGGLTPPLAVLRGWSKERLEHNEYGSLEYACALIAETATRFADEEERASPEQLRAEGIFVDPNADPGRICLPTPFDFSSRNMQFLDQIDCIRESLKESPGWIESELLNDVAVNDSVRTMGWDTTAKVPGAQYPGRTMTSRPTAEWLAFRGLVFLPAFGRGRHVQATACRGRRLDGEFIWPIWVPLASASAIRSLLGYPRLESQRLTSLRALGVAQVFLSHFDKLGKYDAIFTPAEPIGCPKNQTK